jgi:WD40 repeat protein
VPTRPFASKDGQVPKTTHLVDLLASKVTANGRSNGNLQKKPISDAATLVSMHRLTLLFLLSYCLGSANAVEVVVQSAHTARITDLAYTKQGSLLISASDDGTARIWDAKTGHLLRLIEAHAGGVSGLAISYDDKYVTTVGKDGYAKVWSIESGRLIRQIALTDSVTSISCSPIAPECAVAAGSQVFLLPLSPAQQVRSLVQLNAMALRYMPDGKHIAVSSMMGPALCVIDSSSGQTVTQTKTQLPLSHLRTSGTDIYGTTNYDVFSFDGAAPGLNIKGAAKSKNSIGGFDVDGSGHVIAAVYGESMPTWQGDQVSPSTPLLLPGAVYQSVVLDASGSQMAFGDASGSLYIVDRATGKVEHQIAGHTDLVYQTVFSPDGSLVITGGQGPTTRVWSVGNNEQTVSLQGMALDVRAAAWIKNRTLLVTSAPMRISVWDVAHRHVLQQIETKDIDGWPISCHESGVCAWSEGNSINVKNLLRDEPVQTFSIGQDSVIGLDISADGKYLAVAVNRPIVRVWSLATQTELTPLQLELPKSVNSTSPYFVQSWQHALKLYVPSIGMASALHFSTEGHRLAAANEVAIHLWNLDQPGPPQMLGGYSGHISFLDFENGNTRLYAGGDDETIRVWTPEAGTDGKICAHTSLVPANMSLSNDEVIGAVSLPDGEVELWNLHNSTKLANIVLPGTGGWLVYTPDGLFEASENAWNDVDFRFKNQTTNASPVEAYFENYFDPGLLSALLAGETDPRPADPATLDRNEPAVTLSQLSMSQGSFLLDATTPNSEPTFNAATVRFRVEATPTDPTGKVSNLKIYQNGMLVKDWHRHLNSNSTHAAVEEFEISMVAGSNHISAVAFNQDGIQSQERTWDLPLDKILRMSPFSTLFVLAVGVSEYQDRRYNLDFPASDATVFEKALDHSSSDWAAQQTRLMDWNAHPSILEASNQLNELPRHTVVKLLVNEQATKSSILSAIQDLVTSAKPEDAVILYFSGHGVVADQHFYFLPHDSAIQADPQKLIPPLVIRKAAATVLSDSDLESALQDLNVAHAALIFDACESGQVLAGSELRGPRLYPGLGRLAYEKGIYLLAASEESEPAAQLKELNQSVLTYALVEEGLLGLHAADANPRDGTIDLREWLSYANGRVPSLIADTLKKRSGPSPQETQHPQFSPRHIPEASRLVLFVDETTP